MQVHRFSKPVKTRVTYCGDHYCGGHVYSKVTCTCGWEHEGQYGHKDAIDEHKSDIIQLVAGIHFEQDV